MIFLIRSLLAKAKVMLPVFQSIAQSMALLSLAIGALAICTTVRAQSESPVDDSDQASVEASQIPDSFRPDRLVPWCIVPFDASKRTPEQRVKMLNELGFKRVAYDWREEHVSTFEEEFNLYQKNGIELFAFWGIHAEAFELFQQLDWHPQIWLTLADPGGEATDRAERIAQSLLPIVTKTAELKLQLGLYNHGGWGGQPENMVAVCRILQDMGHTHVGIVYNFHHGHDRIQNWKSDLQLMLPYLICLNLNGMNDQAQPKILAIGQGQHDRQMIQAIIEGGYRGPIGIIDHQESRDTYEVLNENLSGLKKLLEEVAKPNEKNFPAERDGLSSQEFHPDLVQQLVGQSILHGDSNRGAALFGSDQLACVSCHQVSRSDQEALGGNIGPTLETILQRRQPQQIVESVFWPQREVAPEFRLWQILTTDGKVHSGFRLDDGDSQINLRDTASEKTVVIQTGEVDSMTVGGSPMPDGLMSRLSTQQRWDLLSFLFDLRSSGKLTDDQWSVVEQSYRHGPANFEVAKQPIQPINWPNHSADVNRDRIYDFYTKQAEHFRRQAVSPWLLPAYPGLDGGTMGHWGNQNETTWADNRWNETVLSSVQSGVFRHEGLLVPRGICVQLGQAESIACCFDPDTFSYPAVWQGGFVKFSSVRHGFLDGIQMQGHPVDSSLMASSTGAVFDSQEKNAKYLGLYRIGARIVFAYQVDQQVFLDAPTLVDGKFSRVVAPIESHPFKDWVLEPSEAQWPSMSHDEWSVEISSARFGPIAIDTIGIPFENSWKALFFVGGHDFLPDGSAMVCTMQGDVWRVSGLEEGSDKATWHRFASGLHQPLGVWIDNQGIFVTCRDQIVRLIDYNSDWEADFYECFSRAMICSPAGHDFHCDLQRDTSGRFYVASGKQGLVRVSSDGSQSQELATGLRNPDGVGLMPDGTLTVPSSEGDWTPCSMICAVKPDFEPEVRRESQLQDTTQPPFFGYRGPQPGKRPELPLVYLPRGLDNSSGGQSIVPSDTWGSLAGQMLHFSYGTGNWFTVLVDQVGSIQQGAVAPVIGDFLSGVHRGRFNKSDGHLYVSGMNGWGSYTVQDGCFQRVRLTSPDFQHPINFHAHRNGLVIQFAQTLDPEVAGVPSNHFAQAWNYRYSGAYGSPEFSPSHPGMVAHDSITITKAIVVDQRMLFLEIPDLQPVNQLHLRMNVNRSDRFHTLNPAGSGHDLFFTLHQLDEDFKDYPGYLQYDKTDAPHPILRDLANMQRSSQNRWVKRAEPEKVIEVKTGKNLSFEQSEIRVRPGQKLQLTLRNADVVPHNWVLVKPDRLNSVGEKANRLISNPDSYLRQYVPETEDVLVYTDIVDGGQQQTIYFASPTEPGHYPYLCTFPGHWMVMNGILVVEP